MVCGTGRERLMSKASRVESCSKNYLGRRYIEDMTNFSDLSWNAGGGRLWVVEDEGP